MKLHGKKVQINLRRGRDRRGLIHKEPMTPQHPYLDPVLDFAGVVPDDEGGLHDGGELDVAVPFVLTLELVQQGLIGSLREAGGNGRDSHRRWETEKKDRTDSYVGPSTTVRLRAIVGERRRRRALGHATLV